MNEPNGPKPSFLKHLAGMLPGMVAARRAGKLIGLGKRAKYPHKVCKICGKMFDEKEGQPEKIESTTCGSCASALSQGFIAAVSGDNRYAFILPPKPLLKFRGTIQPTTKEQMDEIQRREKLQRHKPCCGTNPCKN